MSTTITDDARDTFYRTRRGYIDEVVQNTKLKPLTRIVGVAIAAMTNAKSGDTFVDPTTIARRLCFKRNECVEAIKQLSQAPHFHLETIRDVGAKDAASRGRTVLKLRRTYDGAALDAGQP
jgi:hypothetical protein